jgi:hypothetical protein
VTIRAVTTCPPAHHSGDHFQCRGTGDSILWLPARTLQGHRSHSLRGDRFRAHPHKSERRQHNQPLRYLTRHIAPQP